MVETQRILIGSYDDTAIATAEFEYHRGENHNPDCWCEGLSDEQLNDSIWNDSFIFENALENLYECINEAMNGCGYWYVEGSNLGWQHRSGYKHFKAEDAQELFREILPKTDCNFHVYKDGDEIVINNFHHDAPTGEWYHIRKATEQEIEEGYYD